MNAHDRRELVLELLERRGRLPVQELLEALACAPATLRRDLTELARRGKVVRTHGGVVHPACLRGEAVFQQRTQVAAEAKEAMAAVAAGLVGSGVSVFIDAGTSALAVARRLVPRRELTLFTSSVPLLQMGFGDGARVVAIGGELRVPSQSLVGAPALAWLDGLHFDTAFLGASGLHARDGACVTSLEEAAVKRAVLKRSAMVVLLADAGKWQRPAAVGFAGWSAFDVWVTDMPVPSGTESTQPAVKILVAGEAV